MRKRNDLALLKAKAFDTEFLTHPATEQLEREVKDCKLCWGIQKMALQKGFGSLSTRTQSD